MSSARSIFWLLLVLAALGTVQTAWAEGSNGGIEIGGGSEDCTGNDDCGDVGGGSDDLDDPACPECLTLPVGFIEDFRDRDPADDLDGLLNDIKTAIGGGANVSGNRVNFGEPYPTFCVWEDVLEIESIALDVVVPDGPMPTPRNAKIRKLDPGTKGGEKIVVVLNGITTLITTETYRPGIGAYHVNLELMAALVQNGFSVTETMNYLIVTEHDDPYMVDIHEVSIDVQDTGITTTEIALEPDTNDQTNCPGAL